jgi:hypothetical protein
MPRRLALLLAFVTGLAPAASWSAGAEPFVADLYASLADTSQPGGLARITGPDQRRRYLTERLAAVFDAADASPEPCIDFAPELDAQDWDGAELTRTLALSTSSTDSGAEVVVARFTVFGEPREITWTFVAEGDRMLIDDISGMSGSLAALTCDG